MAPTISREDKGEGSRSKTRSVLRHRDLTPSVTTRSRAAESDSARGKRRAARAAAKEHPNKPKRARAADKSRKEEEDTGRRSTGHQEASTSDAAKQIATSSQDSSAISSPLRCPYIPDDTEEPIDSAIVRAYFKERKKYRTKLDRQHKLATLDYNAPLCSLSSNELLPNRESVMKIVFQAAKVVLGLSSSFGGKPLARCSGFFIEWDSKAQVGFVLTSGHIICTQYPSIHDTSGKRQYASNAQVQVHLPNDTTMDAELLHYDNHYHIALFKVDVNPPATVPTLSSDVKHSQDVFLLGRNENIYMTTNYGRVIYENPGLYDPKYYMFVNCNVDKCGAGGPVISFDGKFIGMANPTPRKAFIPASIILRCFQMWKKFKCIPRLHLGMVLSAIKCLAPSHIEKISSKFEIDEGFIVEEIAEGSNAEQVGIRVGDIITCWNGKIVSTTVDLDDMLLGICEDHLNRGNSNVSTMVVTVGVFHIRKESHCTKQFTVFVSDDVEIVRRGRYPVSATEGPSSSESSDDEVPRDRRDAPAHNC